MLRVPRVVEAGLQMTASVAVTLPNICMVVVGEECASLKGEKKG
jgi:hypothetical protein